MPVTLRAAIDARTLAWLLAALSLMLLLGRVSPAAAQGQSAGSGGEGATSMDQIDMANPAPGQALGSPPAAPAERSPFVDDSKISAQLRTFYFNRENFNDTRNEAWAIGGSVSYLSGYLADRFRVGAVVYTSQPLYAPDDRDGTLLLKPGQEGYTVLGQLYGEYRFTDRIFAAIGRKAYETPYINTFDVRMTPKTFEGVTAYGTAGGKNGAPAWKFGGGYLSKIKELNSDEFVWMSRDAGAAVDRGVFLGGANYAQKDFSLGAINYYSDDIINIFYTEAKTALSLANGGKVKLAAQFTDQRSTGDNLLMGQSFSTNQWGIKGEFGLSAAQLTVGFTDTASGADIQSPWSGHPGYTMAQVQNFNRAGESALILKVAYDLARQWREGASAYALLVHGSGRNAPAYNEDEFDLNLQWAYKTGSLRGLSFRLRYAVVMQRGGGDPSLNDFRFIVNYDFPRP